MSDMNRGYHGYAMSRRAVAAYEVGAKPLSKWGRTDLDAFLALTAELGIDFGVTTLAEFRELLRDRARVSWHHTSKYANRTDFYHPLGLAGLDEDDIAELDGGPLDEEIVEELRLAARRVALHREFLQRLEREVAG